VWGNIDGAGIGQNQIGKGTGIGAGTNQQSISRAKNEFGEHKRPWHDRENCELPHQLIVPTGLPDIPMKGAGNVYILKKA
jgi:hypothetical protein